MPTLPSVRLHSNMTMDQLINALNENFNLLQNQSQSQLFKDENGTNRIAIGKSGETNYGIRISKLDKDVTLATDDELIFNSNQNVFKIITTNTASFGIPDLGPGASFTYPVAHGLSTIPAVLAYVNGTGSPYLISGRYYCIPHIIPVSIGGVYQAGIQYRLEIDNTNILFIVSNYTGVAATGLGAATYKYYVMQETAA